MASSIEYRNERILKWRSGILSALSDKILFFAHQKQIEPKSNLVLFVESWEYCCGGNLDQLNSRKEVKQFADLVELSINSLMSEEYYQYYDYEKEGKLVNEVLSSSLHLLKRAKEIASNEWRDENLFIDRTYVLKSISKILLNSAIKTKLDPSSKLMNFLLILDNDRLRIRDVNIRSKEELEQFIELLELSMKTVIDENFFEEFYFLNYLTSLKKIGKNWDHAISEEWKQGKSVIIEETVWYNTVNEQSSNLAAKPKSILKDLVKFIIDLSVGLINIAIILGFVILLVNLLPKVHV